MNKIVISSASPSNMWFCYAAPITGSEKGRGSPVLSVLGVDIVSVKKGRARVMWELHRMGGRVVVVSLESLDNFARPLAIALTDSWRAVQGT